MAVAVHRRGCLPGGRAHPACRSTPCGVRRRPVGFHPGNRPAGADAPLQPELRLHRDPGPQWRLVAKELIFAMLAPRHEAVAMLSRAYRTPVHLSTAYGRLFELTGFLAWLTGCGIGSLSEIDDDCCHAYLAHRRYVRDLDGFRSASLARPHGGTPPRSSSTCSATGSCSPPTASPPAFVPWARSPPRPSRRCPAARR